jgi:hypothetical protein
VVRAEFVVVVWFDCRNFLLSSEPGWGGYVRGCAAHSDLISSQA